MTKLCSIAVCLFFFPQSSIHDFQIHPKHNNSKTPVEPTYQLAFASFAPLNTDIFIANNDGSDARPLLPHSTNDYNGSFSPDGQWIVFTSERNGPADIYLTRTDGTGLEQLTNDPAFDDQAVFSPDGKMIAFVSTRSGQADIYILDLATKKSVNITNHAGGDFRPCWSPDGNWIAFTSDRTSKNPRPIFTIQHSTEIYTMRNDGSEVTRRTFMDASAGSPCWSPDGKQLLFYEATISQLRKMLMPVPEPSSTHLSIVTLANNAKQTIIKDSSEKIYPRWFSDGKIAYVTLQEKGAIQFLNSNKSIKGEFHNPSWSVDGKKMLYHREVSHNWPPFHKLYSRDKQFQLIRSGLFPCFSPSGKYLICNDKRAGMLHNQIMMMDADGTNRSILFGDSVKNAFTPVWSPQEDKIAFGFGHYHQSFLGPAIGDIAIINRNGTGLKILTNGRSNFGFPSWSPDGKKLVCRAATDSMRGLFIIEIETGKITPLTANNHDNFPAWSPNGDLIAFTSKKGGNYDIYTIKPDGTDLKRLTTDPGNDAHGVWSPDSKWIAFSSGKTGFKDESALHTYNPQPYGEICVMRADGSDLRVLTDNQFEEATPAWMPLVKINKN